MQSGATCNIFFTFILLIAQVFNIHNSPAQAQQKSHSRITNTKEVNSQKLSGVSDTPVVALRETLKEDVKNYPGDNNIINPVLPAWSLKKCYETALERNIAVKQGQNNIKASILNYKTAQYSLMPSVSYNIGHYFSFGKNIDPVTNVFSFESFSGGYTTLGLELGLFSGFRKINAIKQSNSLVKASEYGQKKIELELLTNITLIYARLLLAREELKNKRDIIENTFKELDIINEKIKVGRLSKYEFYTFNGRLNTEQADLVTLRNDSLAASQDLKQLMNISYREKFDITSIDEAALSDIYAANISGDDLIESILKAHPAIKQAEAEVAAARAAVKIAKSNFLPDLSVGGNLVSNYNTDERDINGGKIPLSTQLNDNLGKNINIGLRIPVFSQLQNATLVRKEKLNIANAQMDVENARNSITTNILHLTDDFNAAKEKYKANLSALEQNKLSYSLYQEKYRLGQISSVELITARDILNSATTNYLEAKIQLFFHFQLIELLRRYSRA